MKAVLKSFGPDRSEQIAAIAFLGSAPFYVLCRLHHFCMAGHLKHSDDLTPFAYLTDGLWILGNLLAIILFFRSEISFRYAFLFFLGTVFLLFSSPIGLGGILQFPVLIVLGLFCVASLANWIP